MLLAPIARNSCIRASGDAYVTVTISEFDDGQRESGALQQAAEIAHVGEGGDARRGAAGELGFRREPGLAQLRQGRAAE